MTAVAGRTAPASDGELCVGQFPDLTKEDNQLLAEAKKAFVYKDKYPLSYASAKRKLITRIRGLQTAAEVPGQTGPDKLKLVARLINFREVVRMFGTAPAEYLAPEAKPASEPQVYYSGNISAGLSGELKALLGDFLNDVNGQARNIFLAENIGNEIKILRSGGAEKKNGANEPATRSIVVDNSYELPEQAAVIVHEAAHLEYTYRFAGDPAKLNGQLAERFADIREKAWWDAYLETADLSEESRGKAVVCRDLVMGRISELNLKLGLRPDDLSPDQ